jgi:hypothetical protein
MQASLFSSPSIQSRSPASLPFSQAVFYAKYISVLCPGLHTATLTFKSAPVSPKIRILDSSVVTIYHSPGLTSPVSDELSVTIV